MSVKSKSLLFLVLLLVSQAYSFCPYSFLFGKKDSMKNLNEQTDKLEQSQYQGSANSTQTYYWKQIQNFKYQPWNMPPTKGAGVTSALDSIKFAFESMSVPVERVEDTMPEGRVKWVHPIGSCGKVKFVPNAFSKNSYSGLFQGADFGIARLSLAVDPSAQGFIPGMAIKFFRDNNQVSGNVISMFSLNGQGDNQNFFQNTFSNIVPEPDSLSLKLAAFVTFKRASSCPTTLALGDFAAYDQSGKYYPYSRFPKQIYFVPTQQISNKISPNSQRDFRDNIYNAVNPGDVIYDVYVSEEKYGQRYPVGQIIADSQFIASDFCDNKLFFKHQIGETIGC